MPTRKTFRRRRNYRRKPWYARKYNAMQLAAKAAKGVWYLKGLVNSEMNHYTANNVITLGNAASPTILNLFSPIAEGIDDVSRVGQSIFVRAIKFRINIILNSTSSTGFRFLLVQDNQTISDTAPTLTDVLQTGSTLAFLNHNTLGRFKVLKNWYFTLDSAKANSKDISYNQVMRHHVRFNGASAGDTQRGAIFLMMFCDVSSNQPTLSYNYRIDFHDN